MFLAVAASGEHRRFSTDAIGQMTKKEFTERMAQIDPYSDGAVDQLAALFEEDYLTAGRDLNDPAVAEQILAEAKADLALFMGKYDDLLEKIHGELRKAGATEAQINWGLFGNVELPTLSYIRCNSMAKKMIRIGCQITFCLGEIKMLSKYTEIDLDELIRIQREYRRRFG